MSENPKQKLDRKQRDKEILKLYPELTMEEIAKRYELTRGRIKQILAKVEKKIKSKQYET